VRVPEAAPAFTEKMPILILQYPKTQPLKLALDTEGVLRLNSNGTRVRYATNTEGGSSGSPCFNINWTLVALHHYGDPSYGQPKYNQGIPVNMIRDRLKRFGKDGALGGNSP
jgi:V8-like Glu-specific endopeptidase